LPADETKRKEYIAAGYCLEAMKFATNWEWKLLIALWRFAGLRRACEPIRLKWSHVLWEKRLIYVYSSKTGKGRYVPIFPEVMEPLLKVRELAASDAEWVLNRACPKKFRLNPSRREVESKGVNLDTEFNRICVKAGLPIYPMAGNNMRASFVKDLYSGKFPELRGRVDLIAKICGHSPATALKFYERFSTDDLTPLIDSFNYPHALSDETIRNLESVNAVKSGGRETVKREIREVTNIDISETINSEIYAVVAGSQCVKKCVANDKKEANLTHLMPNPPQENACFVAPDASR
jgi:hypothetical protein